MDVLCKISTSDRLSDNYPSPIHNITIRNVEDKHGFIYITINSNNTTILVDGKELIDGIQRCLT